MTTISDNTLDQNLVSVDRSLRRITASLVVDRDEATLTRLVSVRETIATLVEQVKKELPKNADRKNLILGLSIMHNSTSSVIDLAQEKELSSADANEFVAKNQKRILKVSTLISSLREVAAKKSRQSEETEANDDGQTLRELVLMEENAIRRYQPYRKLLPVTNRETNKSFVVQRVPILFKSNPEFNAHDLRKAGFQAPEIKVADPTGSSRAVGINHAIKREDKVVLENQMVIGLNLRKITEEKKKPKEYRAAIIKILSAQHHTRFIEMSEMRPGLGTSGFIYSWVMEEKELDRILKATHKPLKVVEWGFAFR